MRSTWADRIAVFDLETTGVDVETARIVTAYVGVLDADGTVVDSWEWLADPGVEIPAGATAVHGVSTEHARAHGRPAKHVVAEIVMTLETLGFEGLPLVIYNAPYDLTLLAREAKRYRIAPLDRHSPVIDPLVIDKTVDRFRRGKRTLTAAAAHYGVDLRDAHTAGADAVAAGRVAQALAGAYADLLGDDVDDLHDRQVRWCRAQALSFQDYVRRERDPAFTVETEWPERPYDREKARAAVAALKAAEAEALLAAAGGAA